MPSDSSVHSQLCQKLRRDILRIALHLAVDFKLNHVGLLDYALE